MSCFHFRFGVSHRAAAALASGLLKDLGIISDEDKTEVIDPAKIQREVKRVCAEAVGARDSELNGITCIGLDGKRDSNVVTFKDITNSDGSTTLFRTTATVEHITFTAESGKLEEWLIIIKLSLIRIN